MTSSQTDTLLTQSEVIALLKDGVEGSTCRFLPERMRAGTLRKLEKLWCHKRAELMPEAPDVPFSNGKRGPAKRYSRAAAQRLKTWLLMPEGHYGTKEKPRLDLRAAADHVGCDKETVLTWLRAKALMDWSRNGKGKILTFTLDDLNAMKAQRAREQDGVVIGAGGTPRITIQVAARVLGWSKQKVQKAIRRAGRRGRRAGAAMPTDCQKECLGSGRKVITLAPEGLEQLRADIDERKRKEGYATESELAKLVGAKSRGAKQELGECLRFWHELGDLQAEQAIVETTISSLVRGKSVSRTLTQDLLTYKTKEFVKLWTKTCSAKTGAIELKLLLPFGKPRSVVKVDAEMRAKGFIGRRLAEAKHLAGVSARLLGGSRVGEAWICERIDPKKQVNITEILRQIFAKGPLLATDYRLQLEAKGLSRHSSAVKQAQTELGFHSVSIGWGGPWYCYIDGQSRPAREGNGLQRPPGSTAKKNGQAGETPGIRLTGRQKLILETMLARGITKEDARESQHAIVKIINPHVDPESYKHDFAVLHKHGLTESVRGPNGGVWLTEKGISLARQN